MANLQNKVLLDPRIAIGGNPVQTTTIGCEQVLNRRIPATNQSTTQVQWQSLINPSQALTGRVLVIEYTVTIVAPTTANPPGEGDVVFPIVNGIANSGANPLLPTAVLRSNPLARVCNNLTVGINSQSTSINPQYVHGVMGFALLTPAERKKFASMFPSMLDTSTLLTNSASSSNQPLSRYCHSDVTTRASLMPTTSPAIAGAADYTYVFTVYEPIIISPFANGLYNETALGNVQNLDISLQLDNSNLLLNIVSSYLECVVGAGENIVSIALENFQLHVEYLTPPRFVEIPPVCVYTYDTIVPSSKTFTVVNPGSSVQSDSLKLTVMPKLVYVSCNPQFSSRDARCPDTGASITKLQVIWGSQGSSFLSEMVPFDLWRMTCRNTGCDMSFNQWVNGGYAVCFDPAKDFGANLQSGYSGEAGSALMFSLQCTYNINNYLNTGCSDTVYTGDNNQWLLNIATVFQGNIKISENSAELNIATVTPNELAVAIDEGLITEEVVKPTVNGRGLFSGFKGIFHSAHSFVHHGAKALSHPTSQAIIEHFAKTGPRKRGGAMTGGRILQNY